VLRRVTSGFGKDSRTERHLAPVGKETPGRDEVVAGRAVGDRVGSAGVVAHHAAEHRPIGGRRLGAKEEAVRREIPVEVVADDARLHTDAAAGDIERHDLIEIPAEIDDDPVADHLSGQRRSRASRDQSHAVLTSESHEFPDVDLRLREGHGQRPLLVFRGIGRIGHDGQRVECHFAVESAGERGETAGERGLTGACHGRLRACRGAQGLSGCPLTSFAVDAAARAAGESSPSGMRLMAGKGLSDRGS